MSAPIIKYETGGYRTVINPVEVISETKTFVVVKRVGILDDKPYEDRVKKNGTSRQIHSSWGEAKAYLVKKYETEVDVHRRHLERAKDVLGNIKGMKRPTGEPA